MEQNRYKRKSDDSSDDSSDDASNDASNATLVARVLAGDHDAFARLMARHNKPLFRRIFRLVQDRHHAEDICQEAFIDSFRRLSQLRDREAYYSWLVSIAMNHYRMSLRKKTPELFAIDSCIDDRLLTDTRIPTSSERIDRIAVSEITAGLYSLLSKNEAAAARLYYEDGYSAREVAGILSISPTAVNNRLHKARQRIRTLIHGKTREKTNLIVGLIQLLQERYIMDIIRIELSRELLSLLDDEQHAPNLIESIGRLRESLRKSDNVELPRVRIIDNLALPEQTVAIYINGAETTQRIDDISSPAELMSAIEKRVNDSLLPFMDS